MSFNKLAQRYVLREIVSRQSSHCRHSAGNRRGRCSRHSAAIRRQQPRRRCQRHRYGLSEDHEDIKAGECVHGVCLEPTGHWLFLSVESDHNLRIVNSTTLKTVAVVKLGHHPGRKNQRWFQKWDRGTQRRLWTHPERTQDRFKPTLL